MPILYVAVGRQSGYPLKLVTTKGHLLVRREPEFDAVEDCCDATAQNYPPPL